AGGEGAFPETTKSARETRRRGLLLRRLLQLHRRELLRHLPRRRVAQADRAVEAGARDRLHVRADGDRVHRADLVELREQLARLGLVYAHLALLVEARPGGEERAVLAEPQRKHAPRHLLVLADAV